MQVMRRDMIGINASREILTGWRDVWAINDENKRQGEQEHGYEGEILEIDTTQEKIYTDGDNAIDI